MRKEKLTESSIKKLQHRQKQFKLSDGGGLYLLVHPNGSKYWRFDFRFDGKQKSSSLGVWPEISLSQARLKRNVAKKRINEGINPIEEKRSQKPLGRSRFNENIIGILDTKANTKNISQVNQNQSLTSRNNNRIVLKELMTKVFPEYEEKKFSKINKEDASGIIKNVFDQRKKIFEIVWQIYPSYPLIQLGVLFIMLFFITDFFSALIATSFYFIFSVCFAVGYVLWDKEKFDD